MLLSCHVRVHSCLNVKELLAWNKCLIWSSSDSNGIGSHDHLVRKRTLNHLAKLAKWFSCVVSGYSHMHRRNKYSQQSSIIWLVWLNGWVFVYKLSGCVFESRSCPLNLRYGACFEQRVPWHSGNYRV